MTQDGVVEFDDGAVWLALRQSATREQNKALTKAIAREIEERFARKQTTGRTYRLRRAEDKVVNDQLIPNGHAA